jgi:hypothetical protein
MNATPTTPVLDAGPRRALHGSFPLPCPPEAALPLFTPEGERDWVPGWNPTYLSGATDEAGAVWTTDLHGVRATWVTVVREDRHVRYSRVSTNGTAGLVDVRCASDGAGTRVHVTYDLTATGGGGARVLAQFADEFDEMVQAWHDLTARHLARAG